MARIRSIPPENWDDICKISNAGFHLYLAEEIETGFTKVSIARNALYRANELQIGNHRGLKVAFIFECGSRDISLYIERLITSQFAKFRIRGSWFSLSAAEIAKFLEAQTDG